MDIVERLRDTTGIHEDLIYEAADEIERLQNAIKVQTNAVRVLNDAEMSELNRLRENAQEAYTAMATLDSEREANKILTDEIERLRFELSTCKGYDMNELQKALQDADDMYEKYLGASIRAQRLESGPGGIMDMKQTIADKEAMIYALESQIGLMKNYADAIDKENELLQKYRDFVLMIASEQFELSQEKAQLQQRDWRSKAITLTSQLEFDLNFDTEDTSPLDDNF